MSNEHLKKQWITEVSAGNTERSYAEWVSTHFPSTWHILLDRPGERRSGTVLRVVTDQRCKTIEDVLPLVQEAVR